MLKTSVKSARTAMTALVLLGVVHRPRVVYQSYWTQTGTVSEESPSAPELY